MKLTKETIEEMKNIIFQTETTQGWSDEIEAEVVQDNMLILFTYRVSSEHVEENDYHSEVPYNCYEDMSYNEIVDFEITDIYVSDLKTEEEDIPVENLSELKF